LILPLFATRSKHGSGKSHERKNPGGRCEPDLEGLILQKFRRQIRDGTVSFLFAHDGVEALTMLDQNRDLDMVLSDINMPRMDGLSLLAKLPW
jgi:hypothetical protein